MYHNRAHRKLGRKKEHRLATLRSLSTALFRRERIRTTLMKAKELRPFAEKLITRSKRDDLHARRLVLRHIQDRTVARKLFDTLSARYMERNGGYMRILKLGRRQGDGAEMALVELVGSEPTFKKKEDAGAKKQSLASRLIRGKAASSEPAAPADAEGPPEPGEAPARTPRKKRRSPKEAKKG